MSALLIATRFSPTVQGFYYTFSSILALQAFAELGIGVAVTQFASHEWAYLRIGIGGEIQGDARALSRLASLARLAMKWYSIVAALVMIGLSIGGYVFFSQSPARQDVEWQLPWLALCFLSGINMFTIAIWSLLEGCNQVSNVYLFRLLQAVANTLIVWGAIVLGAGVWTAAITAFTSLIVAGIFLHRRYWYFLRNLLSTTPKHGRVDWKSEILPFQWRIAVSWISGYFIFSLFTPVLFHYHGPVAAGQMGMTWSLVSVLSTVGSAWISPRIPQFGILIAQKRFAELDRLFWRLTTIVTSIAALGGGAIITLVLWLHVYNQRLAHRLLPPIPTAAFVLATIVYTASGPMAAYLRAHKREPLLGVSVLLGLLTGLSTWQLGRLYGAQGMAFGYLSVFLLTTPLTAAIWRRCRVAWHEPDVAFPSEQNDISIRSTSPK